MTILDDWLRFAHLSAKLGLLGARLLDQKREPEVQRQRPIRDHSDNYRDYSCPLCNQGNSG